ncbi:myosin-11-like [Chelonus insularis]|uniref:myosin-11-like n=1 Tax=Chelonus insularis TaxID=460826 RepID=UPI00158A7CD1|nr:myosin-11-like [Chelonus insularis]
MEKILDTPPPEDNAGEMCYGECKDKLEKLKKDFLILKRKIFCSQDLIKKYNNKIKENEQMTTNIQTLQSALKLTEKKLNKRNIAVQSDAVRLQLENEKLRKASEDVAKLKEEYEIKIASDKQYIQQLVCKLKEMEDQNLDKIMKMELEKSGLQGKVKELEREIRNLQKNRGKMGSVSPTKPNELKKRGRKSLNSQKTVGLPVLENDLNCIDIEENDPKPESISESDNIILQECQNTNSANIEVQKLSDAPEIVLENEFKINLSSLEHKLSEKPICIDKNIMTDEYYDLKDNPYPLFCHKCRTLLNSKPVDEILDGMQMKPLITEFSRSPVHERNETSPVIHSNMSMIVENLEKKFKKLEKRVSQIKQTQNFYQNVPPCNHSHVQNCCRDNSMNDSFSLMNMMTTLINTMHSNKKKKKNRTKRLQRCKKKIHRKKNNCIDNWNVEPCNFDNAENTDVDSESLHTPIYTPLINHTRNNRSFRCSTNKNCIENLEEVDNCQPKHHSNTEIEKANKISKKSRKKRTNDNDHIEDEKINDYSEYQKQNNNHTENQCDDNYTVNYNEESSNKITNIEKNVDSDTLIENSENSQIKKVDKVSEIIPVQKPTYNNHHEERNVNYDINTRFDELYSSNATSIELISPSSLHKGAVQKQKKRKTNTNTASVKSSLLTRLRQLRNKSTKLPAKIFRNETLDNVERTEELNDTPIKKRRIAHMPKQDCFDDPKNNSVKTNHEEQLILNRLRVTRSMAKSSLSPNTSLEKESQNSLRSEENSIINNMTNVTNDHSSFQQEHQKDNENSFDKNQIDSNSALDISKKTHSNGQERQDSDKTQGLNNNCENKTSSISYELDNNKEEESLGTLSKVNKIDMKKSDMLIDLENLIENKSNEGIHLENNPELSNELFVSSDSKVEKFPILLEQEEPLISSEPEIKESPVSSKSKQENSLSSSQPEIKESPASSESKQEKFLASSESEIEETSLSLSSKPEKSLASPNSKLEELSVSLGSKPKESSMPGELSASLDTTFNTKEIYPKLTMSSTSNNPVPSDKLSKTSISTSEFYKDCVINLRNRTVAISPLKTINDSNDKSFRQNNGSKSLLDQYILQGKPKSTKKWSKFHHEVAMKLAKGAEEYVKIELKNLLDAETWTSLENEQIVNNLKTINNRSIAKSVVELLIELSDLKEPLDRTFTPPAPMMTKNQQKIVALLKKLDGLKNIIIDVLNSIEYTIFHMNSNISYEAAEELARIFTVLAKIKKDRERVRIMCCDVLYCLQKKGMFILSAVITSWPEVLPSHQEDRFQYLPACIAHAVKTFKHTQNEVSTKITQLNKLIRNMYKYPDEFLTSKSFVEKLLTDLMTPDHDRSVYTAIILLSKKEGSEWTYKNIISGGLLGMIVENKSSNVREALKLLGYLMKSFPIVDQNGYVKKITDQLCAILDSGATSIDIQEGVVFALLSLSRHNFNQIAESISMWEPPQSLSSELEEQLNIFFELRNVNFWKQFKKKRKM